MGLSTKLESVSNGKHKTVESDKLSSSDWMVLVTTPLSFLVFVLLGYTSLEYHAYQYGIDESRLKDYFLKKGIRFAIYEKMHMSESLKKAILPRQISAANLNYTRFFYLAVIGFFFIAFISLAFEDRYSWQVLTYYRIWGILHLPCLYIFLNVGSDLENYRYKN